MFGSKMPSKVGEVVPNVLGCVWHREGRVRGWATTDRRRRPAAQRVAHQRPRGEGGGECRQQRAGLQPAAPRDRPIESVNAPARTIHIGGMPGACSTGGVKQSTFCMAHRKTMITMGSPYFVWINTNEIISSWYSLGAVCVNPPSTRLRQPQRGGVVREELVQRAHAALLHLGFIIASRDHNRQLHTAHRHVCAREITTTHPSCSVRMQPCSTQDSVALSLQKTMHRIC
jgi:hypothetical protein